VPLKAIEIGGRSLERWRTGLLDPRTYKSAANMLRISADRRDFARRYYLGAGSYPAVVGVRTPIGLIELTVYSFDDVQTVNEIFMREDYLARRDARVVVDLGSNIGISAAYFLSRDPRVRCFLYEPVPRNIERLRANLAGFEDRYELHSVAVADGNGEVTFGIEPTGRYGGIGIQTGEDIRVRCEHINDVLDDVLARADEIDVLKIDTEGAEAATVYAIRPDHLDRIRVIYLETHAPVPAHPERFDHSYYNATSRLTRRADRARMGSDR
jgi:FkbM family methyltransferase